MDGKRAVKMHLIGEKMVKEEPELWMCHVWEADVMHDGGRTFRKRNVVNQMSTSSGNERM